MYGFRSDILFPSLSYILFFPPSLNLCTSLWLQCSHAAEKETKSHKGMEMKRLLEVIRNAKLLALQAPTLSSVVVGFFCLFLFFCRCVFVSCLWLSLLLRPSRCCRNQRRGDGESEPRYRCRGPGYDLGMCPEAGDCQWPNNLSLAKCR